MARPRTFSEDVVVRSAMQAFWLNGYEGTSIDDIEKATGLNRSSLYQAFGSKHQLYETVLERYVSTIISPALELASAPGAGLDGAVAFFDWMKRMIVEEPDRASLGCLMSNAIAEVGSVDADVRPIADRFLFRVKEAFIQSLNEAERAGQMQAGTATQRAEVLSAIMLGAFVTVRGASDMSGAASLLESASNLVESWRL